MLQNNVEKDIKVLCAKEGTTQEGVAKAIGTTGQYVNRLIHKKTPIVNKTYITMAEALGYDIKLVYVKRDQKDDSYNMSIEE